MIDDQTAARLIELIDRIATDWDVPGGVVAITDASQTVFEHAFGFADRERGRRTQPSDLFEIGSISKIFTAMVVLQLVEEGMLRLDQPVGEVLDWLPAALGGAELTIERLLQHTAGLVSGVDAVPDQVAQIASFDGGVSTAEPGSFFHYSNLGFIMLGLVAHRLTGVPLARLEQERILDPLGMNATVPAVTNRIHHAMARGYRALHDDQFWLPGDDQVTATWLEVDGADGAIASTAADMAAFARMLIRGTSTVSTMTTHRAPAGEDTIALTGARPIGESRYGLGVNVETADQRTAMSHGGGMVGYASFLLADPHDETGIVVLTNSDGVGPIAEVIARAVTATLRGETIPGLDPERWATDSALESLPRSIDERMLGLFTTELPDRSTATLLVRAEGGRRLVLDAEGTNAALIWGWGDSIGTRHPHFRLFPFGFDGESWTWGDRRYRPEGSACVSTQPSAWQQYLGHYRSYSPWFSNFRIVDREGVLLMLSSPAVESPGDEIELVQLAPDVFRMGADPRLPERLSFGPRIDGRSAWADRDGCRYSRSFLD